MAGKKVTSPFSLYHASQTFLLLPHRNVTPSSFLPPAKPTRSNERRRREGEGEQSQTGLGKKEEQEPVWATCCSCFFPHRYIFTHT